MIKFTKMHGLGNDYVYIDVVNQYIEEESSLAQFVSNRNFGIGSDGLILICKSEVADFKMTMYNQDGSQAEMCGNGIRCVGKFVYDKGLTKKETITIETKAGIKVLELNIKDGVVDTVRVDIGEPILEPDLIPICSKNGEIKDIPMTVEDKLFHLTCVSMGNPHAITVVDKVDSFDVKRYGSQLEIDPMFPNKSNIEFIEIVDKEHIKMRVWERGAGETLACGTGACASVVTCCMNGLTNRKVRVTLLGGELQIEWDESNNHVYMTGPAVTVFDGTLYIN